MNFFSSPFYVKPFFPLLPAAAVKNQETGHLFLNDEDELPESRVVIEKGVAWEYINTVEQESLQTTGPLKYGALLMVSLSKKVQHAYFWSDQMLYQRNHHLPVFPSVRSVPMVTPK